MHPVIASLRTERLVLRPQTVDDAAFVLAILNDPDFVRYVGDRGLRTAADAASFIRDSVIPHYARHGFGMLVVERSDAREPIGICGILKRDHLEIPDLGFAFFPSARGAGYAYEAATAIMRHAAPALGLQRLLAIASPRNEASVALLRRLGFVFDCETTWPGGVEVLSQFVWDGQPVYPRDAATNRDAQQPPAQSP